MKTRKLQKAGGYSCQEKSKGGFGLVLYCSDPVNVPIAVKLVKPGLEGKHNKRALSLLENEKRLLAFIKHPNIIALVNNVILPSPYSDMPHMTMEYCNSGTLTAYIADFENNPGRDINRFDIAKQLGSALNYLHDRHILHLDIKPDNVLLHTTKSQLIVHPEGMYNKSAPHDNIKPDSGQNGDNYTKFITYKLADFGTAQSADEPAKVCGTANYIVPNEYCSFTYYRDLYAYMCVLYFVINGVHYNDVKKGITPANTFKKTQSHAKPLTAKMFNISHSYSYFTELADLIARVPEQLSQSTQQITNQNNSNNRTKKKRRIPLDDGSIYNTVYSQISDFFDKHDKLQNRHQPFNVDLESTVLTSPDNANSQPSFSTTAKIPSLL
jgi:serine/threonine protein kinase